MSRFVALMYHGLKDAPTGNYSISFKAFNAQLRWLKDEGYVVEGLPELEHRLEQNDFPQRYAVMTFDDGHKSDLRAAEMLRKQDAQATFFIVRDYSQNEKGFLNENEIRELSNLCSVGSHGITHAPISRMSLSEMQFELSESKKWLENVVGRRVDMFSAPGGFISSSVVRQARSLGYSLCGSSVEWSNEPGRVMDSRVVDRIAIRRSFLMPAFKKAVRGDLTFLLQRRLRSHLLSIPKRLLSSGQMDSLKQIFHGTRT